MCAAMTTAESPAWKSYGDGRCIAIEPVINTIAIPSAVQQFSVDRTRLES